jgi:hypothetical protein
VLARASSKLLHCTALAKVLKKTMINYVYHGEVIMSQNQPRIVLKARNSLQIKGVSNSRVKLSLSFMKYQTVQSCGTAEVQLHAFLTSAPDVGDL